MTQTTFTDNVLVDGSQDIEQLRVQGHSTQNDALQTWENSAGDVLAQVTGDGRLLVGDDVGLTSPDALLEAHRADTSTTKPKRGFHSLGQVSGTLATLVQWIVGELELKGSSAIDALHTALRVRVTNKNTGTPTSNAELRAADVEVVNDATASEDTLPKATGLQVAVTNAADKTITDAAALRLKVNNQGTITNPYAIYSEGEGVTHLEDFLELKHVDEPPTPAPDFMRVYPKSDGKLYAKNSDGTEYDLTSANTLLHPPCATVAVSNVDIGSAPSSIDSVTLANNDRILLTAQTVTSENGLWVFNGSGNALTRPTDYPAGDDHTAERGLLVNVRGGAVNIESWWYLATTGSITIDTTATTWTKLNSNTDFSIIGNTRLKETSGILSIRNAADTADASVRAQSLELINSGFKGTFTHPNTADRTYTMIDASDYVPLNRSLGTVRSVRVTSAFGVAVSISSAPSAVDGTTLTSGDYILLRSNSPTTQNGIWVFNGTGNALTRPPEFPSGSTILAGTVVRVQAGSSYQLGYFYLNATAVVDSGAQSWLLDQPHYNGLFIVANAGIGTGYAQFLQSGLVGLNQFMFPVIGNSNLLANGTMASLRHPVRVVAVSNVSVSSAPSSIDGVTLASGDRILLANQGAGVTNERQNGPWVFNGAGSALTRPYDFSTQTSSGMIATHSMYYVAEGNRYTKSLWKMDTPTNSSVAVGSTQTTWSQVGFLLSSLDLIIGGFKGTFTHANTADRTYTLPDASDTLVGKNTTDILANKKFTDGLIVNDGASATGDFQVKGDTDDNALFVDASVDGVGVGTNTPDASAKLHVVSTSKGAIARPVMTAAQVAAISTPAEGLRAYESDTEHEDVYDGQRFRSLGIIGWTPHAFPVWHDAAAAFASTTALAANGGSLAIAINVPAHMLLQSVSVRQTGVSGARTWGWDLYEQYLNNGNSGENTLTRVAASNGTDSFTAAGASMRTLDVASAPVYLAPGVYWLVIQNRHASIVFHIGTTAGAVLAAGGNYQTKTTTNPNGSTLDFVAATWAKSTSFVGVMLNGRVFGQTAAF